MIHNSSGGDHTIVAYGNAVERLVAIEARNSSPALFQHLGGAGRPDFFGVGRAAGMTFDVTTPEQVASHLARPYVEPHLNQ